MASILLECRSSPNLQSSNRSLGTSHSFRPHDHTIHIWPWSGPFLVSSRLLWAPFPSFKTPQTSHICSSLSKKVLGQWPPPAYKISTPVHQNIFLIGWTAKLGDFCASGAAVKLPRSKPQVPADVTGSNPAWEIQCGWEIRWFSPSPFFGKRSFCSWEPPGVDSRWASPSETQPFCVAWEAARMVGLLP